MTRVDSAQDVIDALRFCLMAQREPLWSFPPELVEAIAEGVAERVATKSPSPQVAWMDVDAAAEYLACSPQRIYDLVSLGRLRPAKDGRRSLFRREWLDEVLE